MRLRLFHWLGVIGAAVSLSACGDDDSGADCDAGSVLVAGKCVVDGDAMTPIGGSGGKGGHGGKGGASGTSGAGGSKPPVTTCEDGGIERDGECLAIDGGIDDKSDGAIDGGIDGSTCELQSECSVGILPGSACRPDTDDPCSALDSAGFPAWPTTVGSSAPMVCENNRCRVDCA
ncbi:MAG TPA: hypothetical protein VK509_02270, partial [Polyangiales bacterium]|nr:hypothetical protein [Polyangiales bacterium]